MLHLPNGIYNKIKSNDSNEAIDLSHVFSGVEFLRDFNKNHSNSVDFGFQHFVSYTHEVFVYSPPRLDIK